MILLPPPTLNTPHADDRASGGYPPDSVHVWMPLANRAAKGHGFEYTRVLDGDLVAVSQRPSPEMTLGGNFVLRLIGRPVQRRPHKVIKIAAPIDAVERPGGRPSRVLGIATGRAIQRGGVAYVQTVVSGVALLRRCWLPANVQDGETHTLDGQQVSLRVMVLRHTQDYARVALLDFTEA